MNITDHIEHPGFAVKRALIAAGIMSKDFASGIGYPESAVSNILNGKARMSPAFIAMLDSWDESRKVIAISAEELITRQSMHDLYVYRMTNQEPEKEMENVQTQQNETSRIISSAEAEGMVGVVNTIGETGPSTGHRDPISNDACISRQVNIPSKTEPAAPVVDVESEDQKEKKKKFFTSDKKLQVEYWVCEEITKGNINPFKHTAEEIRALFDKTELAESIKELGEAYTDTNIRNAVIRVFNFDMGKKQDQTAKLRFTQADNKPPLCFNAASQKEAALAADEAALKAMLADIKAQRKALK
jgi:plasmid maintenance system antidote protein VapI